MQYNFVSDLASRSSNLLVFTVTPDFIANFPKQKSVLAQLDKTYAAQIQAKILQTKFKVDKQASLSVDVYKDKIGQVLLVSQKAKFDSVLNRLSFYRKLANQIFERAKALNAQDLTLVCDLLDFANVENLASFIEAFELSGYSYRKYKSEPSSDLSTIRNFNFVIKSALHLKQTVEQSCRVARAVCLARDLINLPAQECRPEYLAAQARQISRDAKLRCDIYSGNSLKKLKAGGLLAVSQATNHNAYLIKMTYKPKQVKKPKVLALIGKGVTFDSGGLSLKTGPGMETMKSDMSGAAAVLALMSIVSKLAPKHEVRAYIPTCENAIGHKAIRPGDIFKAMNGKTVEILNTDAEGRLILSDAICLANKDRCDWMIDLATLTGACIVALGKEYAGLFSNDKTLSDKIIASGELAAERFWPLPLAPEYKDLLKSPIADLKNIGPRDGGGAITAALFLQEFVGDTKWAHLDIAGPAFSESEKAEIKKGGVGFAVKTLARLVNKL